MVSKSSSEISEIVKKPNAIKNISSVKLKNNLIPSSKIQSNLLSYIHSNAILHNTTKYSSNSKNSYQKKSSNEILKSNENILKSNNYIEKKNKSTDKSTKTNFNEGKESRVESSRPVLSGLNKMSANLSNDFVYNEFSGNHKELLVSSNNFTNDKNVKNFEKTSNSNFTNFNKNSKHVRGNSFTSSNKLISSIYIYKKPKQNESKNRNDSSMSVEQNVVSMKKDPSSNSIYHSLTNVLKDHVSSNRADRSVDLKFLSKNEKNVNDNEKIELENNRNNSKKPSLTSLVSKNTNKISTFASIKGNNSSSNLNKNDFESPEELHYFYVKIFQQNKNLPYKFENETYNLDTNIKDENFEF